MVARADYTFTQILQEAKRVLQLEDADDIGVQTAALLLSSLVVGTTSKRLIEFTGYSADFVEPIIRRCHEEGIFVGDQIDVAWFDDEGGGVALIADVLVANGLARRTCSGSAIPKKDQLPAGDRPV